jgi:hypothetical protein
MAKQPGVPQVLSDGFRALMASLGVALPAALAMGAFSALVDRASLAALAATGRSAMVNQVLAGETVGQEDVLTIALTWEAGSVLGELLVGPLFAAVAIYVGRLWSHGEQRSLYGAVNFAVARYRRMVLPHAGAQLTIRLGMLVIVPGIFFLLQYAFVDAVASLEQEKWPLSRSGKLTRGRRRAIFLVFLPFLVISQVIVFADFWALGVGGWALALMHAVEHLLGLYMAICFYLLYEGRIGGPVAQRADRGAPTT